MQGCHRSAHAFPPSTQIPTRVGFLRVKPHLHSAFPNMADPPHKSCRGLRRSQMRALMELLAHSGLCHLFASAWQNITSVGFCLLFGLILCACHRGCGASVLKQLFPVTQRGSYKHAHVHIHTEEHNKQPPDRRIRLCSSSGLGFKWRKTVSEVLMESKQLYWHLVVIKVHNFIMYWCPFCLFVFYSLHFRPNLTRKRK